MSRVIIYAKKPLIFEVQACHIKKAKPKEPGSCVVAVAIGDQIDELFDGIEVGSARTKILTSDRVIVYKTPAVLRRAIPVFDDTGIWELPAGKYKLGVLSPSKSRAHLMKGRKRTGRNNQSKLRSLVHNKRIVTRAQLMANYTPHGHVGRRRVVA